MTTKSRPSKYEVICFVCYTCVIGRTNSKKEANMIATSHLQAYGHNVGIQTRGNPSTQETK